jgi:hypothetical protein
MVGGLMLLQQRKYMVVGFKQTVDGFVSQKLGLFSRLVAVCIFSPRFSAQFSPVISVVYFLGNPL